VTAALAARGAEQRQAHHAEAAQAVALTLDQCPVAHRADPRKTEGERGAERVARSTNKR
jgi:uncharacterized protein (DUF924 family)